MPTMQWNAALVAKYNTNGPRYTSYPTALALQPDFAPSTRINALQGAQSTLSLYVHLPFCRQLCYYCGCNKVVTRQQHKADQYLTALAQEMMLYQPLVQDKVISQLHFGGGTPTFLTEAQLSRLLALLRQHFSILPDAEISIEIDPRSCSDEKLRHLKQLGINRVSFGVQDLDETVQIAINRVQDTALIRHQVALCRELGFRSINLDLIYGLPYQNATRFADTLAEVIQLNPDRISLFSYAHLPERFAAQRKFAASSLPQPTEKLALMQLAIHQFVAAGYQCIGMDHFAKPHDALAVAQQAGKLQRNFQGYTTAGQDALLGLGVSSISQINGVLWQNSKDVSAYYTDMQSGITTGVLPAVRGVALSGDDRLRAALISQLICHFTLDIAAFSQRWQLTHFWQYFDTALEQLQPFMEDGLIEVYAERLQVTPLGRLWVRSICACFDAYLPRISQQQTQESQQSWQKPQYSSVI